MDQMTLFDENVSQPLAARLRPKTCLLYTSITLGCLSVFIRVKFMKPPQHLNIWGFNLHIFYGFYIRLSMDTPYNTIFPL